jgi:hypothetical protein
MVSAGATGGGMSTLIVSGGAGAFRTTVSPLITTSVISVHSSAQSRHHSTYLCFKIFADSLRGDWSLNRRAFV